MSRDKTLGKEYPVGSEDYKKIFVMHFFRWCTDMDVALVEYETHLEDMSADTILEPIFEATECIDAWKY